ncbi:MAG: hypothetical protein H6724_09715 [Sandaracinus sp.]|nr:hypothetical protein [Sandaracinus sp.]
MSDAFDGVRAQAHAVSVLRRAVAEDRVASGYLFEGPNGVGKERCAIALAKTLLGQSAHARIDKGAHPDVRIFRPRDEAPATSRSSVFAKRCCPTRSSRPSKRNTRS